MATGLEQGNPAKGDEPALTRLVEWVLRRIGPRSDPLRDFTESLLSRFRSGIPISHPDAGVWFATLDAIDSRDKQVAAVVRVSRTRPTEPKEVPVRVAGFGRRGRKLFDEPAAAPQTNDADILLSYSFMLLFSLEDNLRLFGEFVTNEIGRLRGKPEMEIRRNSEWVGGAYPIRE
jgi:hypothetical protein